MMTSIHRTPVVRGLVVGMRLVEEEDKMNNSSDVASVPNDFLYNGVQRRGIIADGIFCCGGY